MSGDLKSSKIKECEVINATLYFVLERSYKFTYKDHKIIYEDDAFMAIQIKNGYYPQFLGEHHKVIKIFKMFWRINAVEEGVIISYIGDD